MAIPAISLGSSVPSHTPQKRIIPDAVLNDVLARIQLSIAGGVLPPALLEPTPPALKITQLK